MLPPIDSATLERNPNFETLYKDLCTRKLNADGSTRETKRQRVHEETRRNLDMARTQVVQTQILTRTLADLPSKAADLPPELHSVIELVTAQLSGHVSFADREVLSGDVEFFLDNISPICRAISEQLTTVAEHLAKIASPVRPPSTSSLPTVASSLSQSTAIDLPSELAAERIELANLAYKVLALHRSVVEAVIRILEQTMHGSLARSTKAKAELLSSRATVLGLQARIHQLSHPPPPDFLVALKGFKSSQLLTEKALLDREVIAHKSQELYEKAGSKAMLDIAKRAEFLEKEIQRTTEEVEKLERGE